jgi:hypothetical protein
MEEAYRNPETTLGENTVWPFLKRTIMWLSNPTSGCLSKRQWGQYVKETNAPQCHCSTIPNNSEAEISVPQRTLISSEIGYPQWNSIQLGKEWNLVVCDSMGRTGDHYANWNKPVSERRPLSISFTCRVLTVVSQKLRVEQWLPKAGERSRERMGQGWSLSPWICG